MPKRGYRPDPEEVEAFARDVERYTRSHAYRPPGETHRIETLDTDDDTKTARRIRPWRLFIVLAPIIFGVGYVGMWLILWALFG